MLTPWQAVCNYAFNLTKARFELPTFRSRSERVPVHENSRILCIMQNPSSARQESGYEEINPLSSQ